jgi:hypothetical protein
MTQSYFDYDKYSDVFKKAQEPIQSLADLNLKTLQSFQYIKPDELGKVTQPEEFIENQIEMAIANGHKALEYLQKSFQIIEKAMLSSAKSVKEDLNKH